MAAGTKLKQKNIRQRRLSKSPRSMERNVAEVLGEMEASNGTQMHVIPKVVFEPNVATLGHDGHYNEEFDFDNESANIIYSYGGGD
ncbi:MAG: hypothetical protein GF401_16540 [Chitinivibrionales bacterium]|nr:hypothetical protein [Chitinivibrionales bacterium]